jgi:hypothetical protein
MICSIEEAWATAGSIHLLCCCCLVLMEVHEGYGALQPRVSASALQECH